MRSVTLKSQLACAVRELEKRRKRYPLWVREKKLNPHVAEAETKAMEAIVATLDKLVLLEEVSEEIKAEAEARKKLAEVPAPIPD